MTDINPAPKWLQSRYATLWTKFGKNSFTHQQAMDTLKENDVKLINVFISELRKIGWINTTIDEKDSRKRVYNLIPPDEIFAEMRA